MEENLFTEKIEKKVESESYKSLGSSFEEIGKDFQSSIPHIIIPTKGDKKQEQSSNEPNEPKRNLFNDKETKWIDNTQKWFLIIVVILVIGYGIYRVFKGKLW
jgi:hypothetical protein